jgi:hypothetical protein
MGMDAYRLLAHLARLRSSRFETLDGHTGNLYLDDINHLHRQLVWVRLGETPEILGYSPRLDAAAAAEDAPASAISSTPGALAEPAPPAGAL